MSKLRFSNAIVILVMLAAAFNGPAMQPVQAAPPNLISITTNYSQDFNTLASSGNNNPWTNDSTLPGWYALRSLVPASTIYNAGNGSSNAGAIYSFGASSASDRALGSVSSGTPGTIYYGMVLKNDNTKPFDGLAISYTGEQWRDGGNASIQSLTFAYQIGSGLVDINAGTWTNFSALDFASPIHTTTAAALDGNAAANRTVITSTIPLSLQPGQEVMLRWTDINDSGSDHGLAVDDLTVTAIFASPQITALTLNQATSDVTPTWKPVSGSITAGFNMDLDPATLFYYLEAPSVTSNNTLAEGYIPFKLNTSNLPTGFYEYWAGKGVCLSCSGDWQPVMWQIITGAQPMFYLKVMPGPAYSLVDGLQYLTGGGDKPLRVSGDYPLGTYHFSGALLGADSSTGTQSFAITFEALPTLTSLALRQSTTGSDPWNSIFGSLAAGYEMKLDPAVANYSLTVETLVPSKPLAEGYYPFTLDGSSVTLALLAFWDAKGVNASATDGWAVYMWNVLQGTQPMLWLKVGAGPSYLLVDGLQRYLNPGTDPYLVVDGKYPIGAYNFNGSITDTLGGTSPLVVNISFIANQAIVGVHPSNLHTFAGVAKSAPVSASDPDGTVVSAAITSGPADITLSDVVPATGTGGSLTATLNIAATTAPGTYNVQITYTNNDLFPQSGVDTVPVTVYPAECPLAPASYPLNVIGAVQGTGMASPIVGNNVTVDGQVTGVFLGSSKLNGFFIQDSGDNDLTTSDGIFIYASDTAYASMPLQVGEWVQASGTVSENKGLTQISLPIPTALPNAITLCGNTPTVSPVAISLPALADVGGVHFLERYESMLVTLAQTLTVTDTYNLNYYGEIVLSNDGRLYTAHNDPVQNALRGTSTNALSRIMVDDGSNTKFPQPMPYLQGSGPDLTLRLGNTTSNVTGILSDLITSTTDIYMLEPTATLTFDTSANPRQAAPRTVGSADIKVSGFNVYNYFTTLNVKPYPTGSPYSSNNTPRGANSAEELVRQTDKLVKVILGTGADVIGVTELEKWSTANASQTLVDAVNLTLAPDSPDRLAVAPDPANGFGPDFIKASIFYKPAKVTPVPGGSLSANDAIFDRFPVAQLFESNANHERFFVVMNHFKSKGSCPSSGDIDSGQGCWNLKRMAQATMELNWFNNTLKPIDPDIIMMGDLNAYGTEDPINTLTTGGLVNEIFTRIADPLQRYSYSFNGESGYLDHALATSTMDLQITGTTIWHVNSDEPVGIDYNQENRLPAFDPYFANLYRASDHDPIVVGLHLLTPQIANTIPDQLTYWGRPWTFAVADNTFIDPKGGPLTFLAALADGSALPGWLNFNATTNTFSATPPLAALGEHMIRITAADLDGATISTTFKLTVANNAPTVLNAIPNQKGTIGSPFSFQFADNTFSDIDIPFGDQLSYVATLEDGSPLPAWMVFNSSSRTFTGTPASLTNVGHLRVRVTASDKQGLFTSTVFEIVVYAEYWLPVVFH